MGAKSVPQQFEEAQAMAAARDRALQTPEEVRAAFLQKRHRVAGIDLRPVTLGTLWLLEDIAHPLVTGGEEGAMGLREICQALFIFQHPESAQAALASGTEEFAAQAMTLALHLLPSDLPQIAAAIQALVTEGLASVAGTANPPEGPLAPTKATESAGR